MPNEEQPSNLAEAIQVEIIRVRDDVLPVYIQIGGGALITVELIIKPALNAATKALAEGDIVAIIQAYQDLKDISL